MADRVGARLRSLSHATLLEIITQQAGASEDALRIAESFAKSLIPAPECMCEVLLSQDLLPHILSRVPNRSHICKATCKTWRRGWKDTLVRRRSALRLAPLNPWSAETICSFAALDGDRLLVLWEDRGGKERLSIVDQQLRGSQGSVEVDMPGDINRLTVGNDSLYISHDSGVRRISLEGPCALAAHRVLATFEEDGRMLYEMLLSPDGKLLFAANMPDRPDEPIIAFDALSLRVRSEFGRSAFGQQAGAYAFGLAVMHTELFAGHQDANRIHAFTLEGQHTRTIRGEWSAPQDLCSINERLFLAATAATAAEAGSSEAGAIFEIGADGRVLQTFQHQAMLPRCDMLRSMMSRYTHVTACPIGDAWNRDGQVWRAARRLAKSAARPSGGTAATDCSAGGELRPDFVFEGQDRRGGGASAMSRITVDALLYKISCVHIRVQFVVVDLGPVTCERELTVC